MLSRFPKTIHRRLNRNQNVSHFIKCYIVTTGAPLGENRKCLFSNSSRLNLSKDGSYSFDGDGSSGRILETFSMYTSFPTTFIYSTLENVVMRVASKELTLISEG
jgi:hypothetical protein